LAGRKAKAPWLPQGSKTEFVQVKVFGKINGEVQRLKSIVSDPYGRGCDWPLQRDRIADKKWGRRVRPVAAVKSDIVAVARFGGGPL